MSPSSQSGEAALTQVPNPVGDVVFTVSETVQKILAHPVFKDIMHASALSISEGGSQEPYNDDVFKQIFTDKSSGADRVYCCALNFMWIDHTKRAMTGVPISNRGVEKLMNTTRIMKGELDTLDIVVNSEHDFPSKRKGAIERISPPEESFAILRLISKDIDDGEQDKLQRWRTFMLRLPVRTRVMPDASEKWWFEYNVREEMGARYDSVYQTTYQKVCAVITLMKQVAEKEGVSACTAARIMNLFKDSASTATAPNIVGAESVSESYIKEVITVRDSLFTNPRCHNIIAELDEIDGHCSVLNSVYKLTAVKRIAKTAPMMEWVLEAIRDCVLSESSYLQPKPSTRDFTTAQNKNVVGTIVAKKQFLDFALVQAAKWFPHHITGKMVEVFSCYEQYRLYAPLKGDRPPLLWMADWPVGPRLFMDFICQAVFGYEAPFLWPFQQCSKQQRCVSSVLDSGALNEEWERIKRVVEEAEKAARVKADKEASAPASA